MKRIPGMLATLTPARHARRLLAWLSGHRCGFGLHAFERCPGRPDLRRCTRCPRVEWFDVRGCGGFASGVWTPLDPQAALAAQLRDFAPRFGPDGG